MLCGEEAILLCDCVHTSTALNLALVLRVMLRQAMMYNCHTLFIIMEGTTNIQYLFIITSIDSALALSLSLLCRLFGSVFLTFSSCRTDKRIYLKLLLDCCSYLISIVSANSGISKTRL